VLRQTITSILEKMLHLIIYLLVLQAIPNGMQVLPAAKFQQYTEVVRVVKTEIHDS